MSISLIISDSCIFMMATYHAVTSPLQRYQTLHNNCYALIASNIEKKKKVVLLWSWFSSNNYIANRGLGKQLVKYIINIKTQSTEIKTASHDLKLFSLHCLISCTQFLPCCLTNLSHLSSQSAAILLWAN